GCCRGSRRSSPRAAVCASPTSTGRTGPSTTSTGTRASTGPSSPSGSPPRGSRTSRWRTAPSSSRTASPTRCSSPSAAGPVRELVVLGTASQVPTRTRNHNGYLLLWDGEGLLLDPGEGTQRQMIHAGVSATQVHRIGLTHVHGDHCDGLPGVLSRMALDGVAHPVHLHYPASGEDVVRALVAVASPGVDLRLHPHGGPGEVAPGLEVRPLLHRVETYGYRLVEPDGRTMVPERLAAAGVRGPDVGRLARDGRLGGVRLEDVSVPRRGQRFAFVMDTAPCPGAEELSEGA